MFTPLCGDVCGSEIIFNEHKLVQLRYVTLLSGKPDTVMYSRCTLYYQTDQCERLRNGINA